MHKTHCKDRARRNGSYAYYVTIFFFQRSILHEIKAWGYCVTWNKQGELIVSQKYVVQTAIIKIVGRLTYPCLEYINLHKSVTLLVYFVTASATLKKN